MGKRNVGLVLMALAALCAAWWMPAEARNEWQQHQEQREERVAARLFDAIESSGAKGVSVEVRTRLSLGKLPGTEDVKDLAEKWARRLDMPHSEAKWAPSTRLFLYQVLANSQGVQVDYQVTGVPHQDGIDTYLVLSIKGNRDSLPYVDLIQDKHEQALVQAGLIPQFSTCIRGMYNVKLSVDQQEGKILSIFDALHARELERLQDETVVSLSGYTSEWNSFLSLNGQARMNLQVATHRDSRDGTWITAGTPIITAEY
ncbi:YwmB family TATA-box binding protein [Brevibacillus borstelensis]|uniref:YwmB family TATA-box binding protein n=1 Tax=Brevibacillus borstelensis TaxID=45462 RepID=UPI0030BDAE99